MLKEDHRRQEDELSELTKDSKLQLRYHLSPHIFSEPGLEPRQKEVVVSSTTAVPCSEEEQRLDIKQEIVYRFLGQLNRWKMSFLL